MGKAKRLPAAVIQPVLIFILLQASGAFAAAATSAYPEGIAMATDRGAAVSVQSPPVDIELQSVPAGMNRQLKEFKPQATMPGTLRRGMLMAIVATALALFTAAVLFGRKLRRASGSPPTEKKFDSLAHAENDLNLLIARGLPEHGDAKQFYILLSTLILNVLRAAGMIPANELTTAEITDHVRFRSDGATDDAALIQHFLENCDIIKFAGYTPSENNHAANIENARRIVRLAQKRSRMP